MSGQPESYANIVRRVMTSHLVPDNMKDPKNWPAGMQDEWEHEVERAHVHLEQHRAAFKKVRAAIDDFKPDAVIIFGDDQYENYKEDIIPPFSVYIQDEFPTKAFRSPENLWGVDPAEPVVYPGAGRLAREITNELIEREFPIAYSYKSLHFERGLTHAFANGLTYLDFDHDNPWTYPIIPIQVNCYGKAVVSNRGGSAQLHDTRPDSEKDPYIDTHGPDGPTARSCYRLGQTLRQVLNDRPERFVVLASSGWSHAFLTAKHYWLWPDRDADRVRMEQLKAGEQHKWADLTNDEIFDAGEQEFKNWICMAGAMEDADTEIVDYLETWIFNSQKCFALLRPNGK
jgi:hypothetical protein